MKLLLSSHACDPYGGSEGIYGWYVVSALAKKYECYVLTDTRFRESIDKARRNGLVPESLHFKYIGRAKPWPKNMLLFRLATWREYHQFAKSSLNVAEQWHKEVRFDVAQLVTYTTWRVSSPLWQLNIPFIWGPISGTEPFPLECVSSLSWPTKLFELIRATQTFLAKRNKDVLDCARNARYIPVPHNQAIEFLTPLRGKREGIELCHNFFFPDWRIQMLANERKHKVTSRPLRAFGAGMLEGRKGVAIALQAIHMAKQRGIRIEYHVTSSGPELGYLKKLSKKLGLEDRVILGERFDASDYAAALATFDVCLLPSLRDGAGLSIMEAMLAGCMPIVADWCGPAEFVTEKCGYKVPIASPDEMAENICNILCSIDKDREALLELGIAASQRISSAYNEKQFLEHMALLYSELV